jgi:hypothetical protein
VPDRLLQLQQLLGDVPLSEVLLLTRKCPPVLAVEQRLVLPRLVQLCHLLQRPYETEVGVAAPSESGVTVDPTCTAKQNSSWQYSALTAE